jgi:hypothetical protein
MHPHTIAFVDGPAAGRTIRIGGPADALPQTFQFPVFPTGLDDDGDDPVAVAMYQRAAMECRLLRLDQSETVLAQARQNASEHRARMTARSFYDNPNYSAYTIPHGSIHQQVYVEHGNRKGHVDERLVPLIQQVWRLRLDTMASCQERPKESKNAGRAYIRFFVRSDAVKVEGMLKNAGFEAFFDEAGMTIRNQAGKEMRIEGGDVSFRSEDIEKITALLQTC